MKWNLLTRTDSYKIAHPKLYPPDTKILYSYISARSSKTYEFVKWFGLQYYLKKFLEGPLFTLQDIEEADEFWSNHFGRSDVFDKGLWKSLYEAHGGCLPVIILAVPEGNIYPIGVPLATIENTDSRFPWLTTYIETLLLKVWYPSTVATQSHFIKERLLQLHEKTSDSDSGVVDFLVHDFGYRGVTSEESAELAGAAHLLSFKGTDTVAGIHMLTDYYNQPMRGFSIPATEHSIIGAFDDERHAFAHVLNTFPDGLVACVSDTYDIYNAVTNLWGDEFKDQILNRNGKLIVRPDSGEPLTQVPNLLLRLATDFGYTVNSKGYRVLNPKIGLIWGDGMDREAILKLYHRITEEGWVTETIAVGAGGGLLQKHNRDDLGFANKTSFAQMGKYWTPKNISKNPITDPSKKSMGGMFRTVYDTEIGSIRTEDGFYVLQTNEVDLLEWVYDNGKLVKHPLQQLEPLPRT